MLFMRPSHINDIVHFGLRITKIGCILGILSSSLSISLASDLHNSGPLFAEGKRIYETHCQRCHGEDGQGKPDEFDEPLSGDRSIKSLARLIERTMPEDEPKAVLGTDASKVAEFIFHEFYSPEAQARRLPPPRIELVRMTVPQYRNAVSDLIGLFSHSRASHSGDKTEGSRDNLEHGLAAEYFQSKGMNKADKLHIERIDQTINFDFEEGSPSEKITPEQFSAIWQGALIANETGYYEFRISTQNGTRLYLNAENTGKRRKMRDDSSLLGQRAIIDAWVSSGKMREHTARVFLLGGRHYPIRLEFFKYKEKTASIKFEWKPPHGTWSLLDDRFAHTGAAPRTYVASVPFPADDRSAGYERGSAVSPGWYEAVTQGAIATATEIIDRLPRLSEFEEGDSNRIEKLQIFVTQFAASAFRRPLSETEKALYQTKLFSGAENPEAAVRRAVLLILTSPNFLYLEPNRNQEAPSQHQIAARLSFALWDSIPDRVLSQAAANGELTTLPQIRSQLERMMKDRRTKFKIQQFFHHWLEIEERDMSKDKELYPEFDELVVSDLRHSLEMFIDQVVWSESSDYRQLLLADDLYLNDRLTSLYAPGQSEGKSSNSPHAFRSVSFSKQRAGILTHPFLLSAFAYHDTTSPIHRGVFLTRNVIGRGLKPPPIAVAFKNEEFPDDLSMREKITLLTRDAACMTCHSIINPLGFALENFDAVGRWRNTENDEPLDTTSEYITLDGDSQQFRSANDLANFAVTSKVSHQAFISHLFRHLVKQTPSAYGKETLNDLRLHFAEEDFSIQKLVAEIALISATHDVPRESTKLAL
jgi:hypothetical protein